MNKKKKQFYIELDDLNRILDSFKNTEPCPKCEDSTQLILFKNKLWFFCESKLNKICRNIFPPNHETIKSFNLLYQQNSEFVDSDYLNQDIPKENYLSDEELTMDAYGYDGDPDDFGSWLEINGYE